METRCAYHYDAGINEALGRPKDSIIDSTERRMTGAADDVLIIPPAMQIPCWDFLRIAGRKIKASRTKNEPERKSQNEIIQAQRDYLPALT